MSSYSDRLASFFALLEHWKRNFNTPCTLCFLLNKITVFRVAKRMFRQVSYLFEWNSDNLELRG